MNERPPRCQICCLHVDGIGEAHVTVSHYG
jgi:hypothetical protein